MDPQLQLTVVVASIAIIVASFGFTAIILYTKGQSHGDLAARLEYEREINRLNEDSRARELEARDNFAQDLSGIDGATGDDLDERLGAIDNA